MPKISVLIIAHNEEKYIKKCIESIFNQSLIPDEIVLIAHNCTDKTEKIANTFSNVKIISYKGPLGIIHARLKGLEYLSGDIVLCIDGDSYAKENWIEIMVKTLQNNNVLIGSWVKVRGTFFAFISSIFSKYLCVLKTEDKYHWIWGPSFAFWGKDKEKIKDIFEKSIELTKKIKLPRNPEDFWLSFFMNKEGKIEITNETHVVCFQKEKSNEEAIFRNIESLRNRKLILKTMV